MTLQDALPLIVIIVNAGVTILLGYLHVANKADVDAVTKSVDDLVAQGVEIVATQRSHAGAIAAVNPSATLRPSPVPITPSPSIKG